MGSGARGARARHPIPNPKSAVGRLAQHLRDGLARRGLGYRELADLTQYHPTTLQRAADGKRVSSWEVVEEFARACGLGIPKARTLWLAARSERVGRRGPRDAPGVEQIYNYADLGPSWPICAKGRGALHTGSWNGEPNRPWNSSVAYRTRLPSELLPAGHGPPCLRCKPS
ncbi:helix-turn-helix domain-containing protein [Streptomyces coelicoflavus]|uniref:helix-turn-helix domain-containing protein n=1 Tax=Streptomyces coelicoflavus TaxID=285562 RepID=UPI000D58E691